LHPVDYQWFKLIFKKNNTMFSINIKLKFALIALFLIGGILLAIFQGFWYSLPFILVGLGLLASYLLLGTVQTAAQLVQEGNFEAAEKRLNLIWKPEWLYKTNKAFYNILKGSLAMNNKDNNAAEVYYNWRTSMHKSKNGMRLKFIS
jgi:hypothetical protein